MELTKKAFKAYDVRGVVPTEVNAEMAYRVGRVFAAMFAAEKVVVGHDIRLSGRELVDALTEGLRHGGSDVIDIGQCGTEMIYFATAHLDADGERSHCRRGRAFARTQDRHRRDRHHRHEVAVWCSSDKEKRP